MAKEILTANSRLFSVCELVLLAVNDPLNNNLRSLSEKLNPILNEVATLVFGVKDSKLNYDAAAKKYAEILSSTPVGDLEAIIEVLTLTEPVTMKLSEVLGTLTAIASQTHVNAITHLPDDMRAEVEKFVTEDERFDVLILGPGS